MTHLPTVPTCEACGEGLPPQPYPGNPRRFGCEACRVWTRRHPGETRSCGRCEALPTDGRHPYAVRTAQQEYRSRVNASRQRTAGR